MLLSRVPYPLEKGDKLRAYHHLKALNKEHKVILVCVNDDKLHPEALKVLGEYCHQIHIIQLSKIKILFNLFKSIFNTTPFQVSYFYQKKAQQKINSIIETELPKHIYFQLIRTAEYVKPYKLIDSTLDYMDAFSMGMQRRALDSKGIKRLIFSKEAERLKRYERDIFRFFKNKTIISTQDRDCIDHPDNHTISIIRNGVDLEYFHPNENHRKNYDLVFTGNMNYPPNIQSAEYLAREIMPLLWKKKPDATLLISGATPAPSVKKLANSKITITGWVDDIRTSYWQSSIFIAPMQLGTGLQNKLLEAMAMKIPCITSKLANNALKAINGKEVIIGSTPDEYVKEILSLLEDKNKYSLIKENAFSFVNQNFSWKNNTENLINLIQKK